ncbi:MAG: PorV/PorQ family protein [candidate division WOR-3 bacterium]
MNVIFFLCTVSVLYWGRVGTSTMPLLRVGQGVRAAAMGEAYAGLADDVSALYWNPAGLAGVRGFNFAFSHHEWFAGIRDEVAHTSIPVGPGSIGLGLLYSGEPGIESWSENNEPLPEFNVWDAIATLGYGMRSGRNMRFGLAAKGVFQSLYGQDAYGGAADLGFAGRLGEWFSIGLAARNFGTAYRSGKWEMLPAEADVGASYSSKSLTTSADIVWPLDNSLNFRVGFEYVVLERLAVRVGYRTGPVDVQTLGYESGLTAGLGVTLGDFGLDYCFAPYGKLGMTHRIGIRLRAQRRNPGIVRIRVVDMRTMEPLWATVTLSGVVQMSSGTNRHGVLLLTDIPTGDLIIHTSYQGYKDRYDTLTVVGGSEQRATIGLTVLDYGGIWAVLFDADTRKTIGGTVSYRGPVYGEEQVDPKLGSFALKNVPVGTYVLEAFGPDPSYAPQTCTLEVSKGLVAEKEFYLSRRGR